MGALEFAAREAMKAVGDATLLIEHYITSPRHVEIQVFGDTQGNVVHLFERECSIQRRHQKVIEESPSPALNEELRGAMGAAAVEAAKAVNYVGAGTVEFILGPDGDFFFLEMNTRLQVEHPVTEAITGVDLVREQIRIADGEPLSFKQDDLHISGAAIECRIYAEDPANQFLPATGTLADWHVPESPWLRVDSGVETGSEVSIHYDPMLAKVITVGGDRNEAIRRMMQALRGLSAQGVITNTDFLLDILNHEAFQSGNLDTHFIDTHFPEEKREKGDISLEHAALAAVLLSADRNRERTLLPGMLSGYRNNPFQPQVVQFEDGEESLSVEYTHTGDLTYKVSVEDSSWTVRLANWNGLHGDAVFDGHRKSFRWTQFNRSVAVQTQEGSSTLTLVPRFPDLEESMDEGSCVSPMPGKVVSIRVSVGDSVVKGQVVASIEAMKMEHQVVAASDGQITQVLVAEGEQVEALAPLVVIEEGEDGEE